MTLEEQIFQLDHRIRYCSVVDAMGKTISGGMRPGVDSLNSEEETERVSLQVALTFQMAQSAQMHLGEADFVIIHRKRVMLIALLGKRKETVLVATEPGFPLDMAKELSRVVEENCRS